MLDHKGDFAHPVGLRVYMRIIVLIVCLLSIMLPLHQIRPVYGATIHVPGDFVTIQEAVDNALVDDTIQVAPDTYYEHVVVTKSLTIIGDDPHTTIVDGTANGTVFELDEVSNVYIANFTIRNAGNTNAAIALTRGIAANDYHQIVNNIITTSQYGVVASYSKSNTIFNNTIISNVFGGVSLNRADNINITGNTIVNNGPYGIRITTNLNADIVGNTFYQNSNGIHISSSSTGTTIRNNRISGRMAGVYSTSDSTTVHHNAIEESGYGIYLYNCYNGAVYYNIFKNNSYGIRLYNPTPLTSNHNIDNNKISDTDWAIEMVYAYGNTFTGNWMQQNTYGIYMSSSSSNTLYHNNFINNSMQTFSGLVAGNQWDNGYPSGGNYWNDYTGVDLLSGPNQNQAGSDGIGDTSYKIIPLGDDNYPLMTTWSEHDISIQNATLSENEVHPSAIVNITVTVINQANMSVSETFNVTAKYDLNIIDTKTVNDLAQGATESLTFNWNTTGVAPGNYTISAEASIVPDELNTGNNIFIGGIIEIKEILLGDINGDGTVNSDDLTLLDEAYSSTPTSGPNWNPYADLNEDDIINLLDLSIFSENYGNTI